MRVITGGLACMAVHPHGRGDNPVRSERRFFDAGSPPRAWGQSAGVRPGFVQFRFTPTGVGTICPARQVPRQVPVHPHGRGDNNANDAANVQPIGSPPRAWGQLEEEEEEYVYHRFTPTGVGTM